MVIEELKYINIFENVLHKTILQRLLKYIDNDIKGEKGRIIDNSSGTVNLQTRDVSIHWLSPNDKSLTDVFWYNYLRNIFKKNLDNYFKIRNMHHGFSKHFEIHFLKYYKGNHYVKHTDYAKTTPREFSFSLILNDDFEGGDFCFFFNDKKFPVNLKANSLLIFPSNFIYPHAIEPITSGMRKAVVGWI